MLMRRAGRTLVATLLCSSLAALTASPMALAQTRGNSGLPAGSGNPIATLEQQVQQNMSSLQRQVDALSSQVATLSAAVANGGSSDKLAVYDSTDQKVGDVVGVQDNIPWVSINVDNRSFVLQVLPQQLVGQFLWFGLSSCTVGPVGREQVYISGMTLSRGANVFALAAVHPDGTLYAAQPNTSPVGVTVASVLDANGLCTSFRPGNQSVVPAAPVINLNSVFHRPYSVR
jgi:hypothetical protein